MRHWSFKPTAAQTPMRGDIRVPGDKSVSHRAVMLSSIANGSCVISGFLPGEDTVATATIFRQLGVRIETIQADALHVHGVGMNGLCGSERDLDCGNAGTAMRLLSGLLAGQAFNSTLTGDHSLRTRPMNRVLEPLRAMGARIESQPGGRAPLHIQAMTQPLNGIRYQPSVASAQVKSCVLLAGLYASGTTRIEESHPTRDYTERLLQAMHYPIAFGPGYAELQGGYSLQATDIRIAGDFSSAAFLIVAASLIPGSELTIRRVGLSPTRIGLLHALSLMGANISIRNMRDEATERVGDITVRHAELEGVEIPREIVPDMIDEFPILFVAAAMANGTTVVRGAEELRVKESDRIESMVNGLRAMGVEIESLPDGAIIHGTQQFTTNADTDANIVIESQGDHRIAMSFAVLAAAAQVPVAIHDVDNVRTSFPGFEDLMESLAIRLQSVTA